MKKLTITLVLLTGALTACGHAAGDTATGAAPGAPANRITVDDHGAAWSRAADPADTTVEVTADSGRNWTSVRLPAPAAGGHSVVARGSFVAAVTVDAQGVAYQRSTDRGATWTKSTADIPADTVNVALSDDGSQVAVLAELPGSASRGALFTGPATGGLTARPAPVGGDVTWLGGHLLLAGGPLHSQLYRSDDDGVTWTQQAVDGTLTPRFNVSPDAAVVGRPVITPAAALVPVSKGGTVTLYRSADGAGFTPAGSVRLSGDLGPGVAAVASTAGPDAVVLADPSGNTLHVVRGGQDTAVTPTGLTGSIDALTFDDPQHGLAEVTATTGCADKQTCAATVAYFRTADGGRTWQPATA